MRKLRLALIAAIILGAAFPVAAQPRDTRNYDTRNSDTGRNGSVILQTTTTPTVIGSSALTSRGCAASRPASRPARRQYPLSAAALRA